MPDRSARPARITVAPGPQPRLCSMQTRKRKKSREEAMYRICLLAVLAAAWFDASVLAQDFPTRPVRIIVPYAPGGGTDITSRIIQDRTVALLGQPLIIENRAGAGTLIGTQMVA